MLQCTSVYEDEFLQQTLLECFISTVSITSILAELEGTCLLVARYMCTCGWNEVFGIHYRNEQGAGHD